MFLFIFIFFIYFPVKLSAQKQTNVYKKYIARMKTYYHKKMYMQLCLLSYIQYFEKKKKSCKKYV